MKLVIADTSSLISLILVQQIELVDKIFGQLYIPKAVWEELKNYDNPELDTGSIQQLENDVLEITSNNYLSIVIDYGESETVILYEEINADYLLIDDTKARTIAESLGVHCIGSIGLLIKAKQKGLVTELKPIFKNWLNNEIYFSKKLLNQILKDVGETQFD